MNTKLLHTVTLGTMLTLAAGPYALAMDHSADGPLEDGARGDGAGAGRRGRPSPEIRKAVVKGYTLTYTLIDMKKMMAASPRR